MRRSILAAILAASSLLGLGWWNYRGRPMQDFAGSSSCRGCHPQFYQLWSASHHGLAMQPFTAEFARRELTWTSGPIRSGSSVYLAALEGKQGWIEERSPAGTHRYSIAHAMGGKNIYYFLTMLERGRLQVLPLAYHVRSKSWIDATASMTLHDHVPRAQGLDWRDPMLTFNTSCHGCHVSQIATNYDPKSDSYRTTWLEPGINCETCHGPSAGHVSAMREVQRGKRPGAARELHLISMKKLSVPQRNAMCASCHAKLTAITSDFKPGDRFFDHYNITTLESDDFFPDGRDYRENYTLTSWLMSRCAKAGKLDCLHCHTSSGGYRFQDNAACLPCHAERVRNAAAHTHHKLNSAGSLCVSCHMPATEYARMRRTDHSMRPPTPATTITYQSPNACNICHRDRDAAWADQQVRRWYDPNYQAPVVSAARLIEAARRGEWNRLPAILEYLRRPDHDEIFAVSLIRLLSNSPEVRQIPALVDLLSDPSPLVRAAAVDALSTHIGPEMLPALKAAAADDYRIVRISAGAALAGLNDARVEPAIAEYVSSLQTRPDDYSQHMNLGVFFSDRGRLREAVNEYETAMRLRPDFAPPLVNASVAYSQLGEDGKAEAALRRALQIDPQDSAANLNLGLLLLEKQRLPEAEAALRKAVETDPANAAAAYNLAVILSRDHLDEAIEFARRAARSRPDIPKYGEALAYYENTRKAR
jgi:tetratricopeptide (TPR) repeat protein